MFLDKQLTMADQLSLAIGLGLSIQGTNSINLLATGTIPGIGGSPIADIGRGKEKKLLVQITADVTSGGAGTLEFQLISGSGVDGAGQINAGERVHNRTRAYALADLKAGDQVELAIPPGINQQYLNVKVINAVAATTGGAFTATIVMDKQTNPSV